MDPEGSDREAGGDSAPTSRTIPVDSWDVEAGDEGFKPLTREEAEKFRASNPSLSPWTLVACQLAAGVLLSVLAFLLTGQSRMAWSAGYGALAVVVPSALFVRGLSRQKHATHGGSALAGFFVWEMVKIALTIALLVAAPRLVDKLSWLALVVGFVVTMKVYWAAVWFRLLRTKSVKNL
ncbi:MAG: ATP synthase subunit I [Comamonadaceae bacterium]|nr:MAG: ATP synthase subunit I [Comamonadaceae bacterium]